MSKYIFTRLVPVKGSGGDDIVIPDFSSAKIEFVESLPTASNTTLGVIYVLIGENGESSSICFTRYDGVNYDWVFIKSGDKGDKGDTGDKGEQGERGPVGVEEVVATVDALPGVPSVITSLIDGTLTLAFFGLKGMQGNPGVNNAETIIVQSLPEASIDTINKVYWIQDEVTGDYNRYITQYDGETYSWIQIGTTSINLADYVRKDSEVWLTKEDFEALGIKDTEKTYNIYEIVEEP